MMKSQTIAPPDELFHQLAEWVRDEPGWKMFSGVMEEAPYPPVSKPDKEGWIIKAPEGELRLEYVGDRKDGTKIVNASVWPTFVTLRLMQFPRSKDWEVVTDAGVPFHLEWNRENFLRLVRDMVTAL